MKSFFISTYLGLLFLGVSKLKLGFLRCIMLKKIGKKLEKKWYFVKKRKGEENKGHFFICCIRAQW